MLDSVDSGINIGKVPPLSLRMLHSSIGNEQKAIYVSSHSKFI